MIMKFCFKKKIYFLVIFLIYSCAVSQKDILLDKKKISFRKITRKIIKKRPQISFYSDKYSPFTFNIIENYKFIINSNEIIKSDFYISNHNDIAPLIIFVHGNKSYKRNHSDQAKRIAAWGMHALVIQLPNIKEWIENGYRIYNLVNLIQKNPNLIKYKNKIDINNIVLVGHSFGGSAVSIAGGLGARISGLILLDPAVYNNKVIKYLKKINTPVILLGADKKIFRSKQRYKFFKNINSNILEISIKKSTHNDAQKPSENNINFFGLNIFSDDKLQQRFINSIISSSISLSMTGNINLAKISFQSLIKKNKMINLKIK